jgi:hypothetical protein
MILVCIPLPTAQTSLGAVPQTLVIDKDDCSHVSIPLQTPLLYFTAGGLWQPVPAANATDGDAAQPAVRAIPTFSVFSDLAQVVPS